MKFETQVIKTRTGYCNRYIVAADYLPYIGEISDPEAGNSETSVVIAPIGDFDGEGSRFYLSQSQWGPFMALVKKMDKIMSVKENE